MNTRKEATVRILQIFVLLLPNITSLVDAQVLPSDLQIISKHHEKPSVAKCREFHDAISSGQRSAQSIGGFAQTTNNIAQPSEFPYMAAVGYWNSLTRSYEFACGGALISDKCVITAAHCKKQKSLRYSVVRMGAVNRWDFLARDFSILKFIVHEEFDQKSGLNDIAVIHLKRRVPFLNSLSIQPACLWPTFDIESSFAHVTRWGRLKSLAEMTDDVNVTLDILEPLDCEGIQAGATFSSDSQVCAGVTTGNFNTCHGDSGAPLTLDKHKNDQNVTYIIGIHAYGYPTCRIGKSAAAYTRVSAYIEWIEENVWGAGN